MATSFLLSKLSQAMPSRNPLLVYVGSIRLHFKWYVATVRSQPLQSPQERDCSIIVDGRVISEATPSANNTKQTAFFLVPTFYFLLFEAVKHILGISVSSMAERNCEQ